MNRRHVFAILTAFCVTACAILCVAACVVAQTQPLTPRGQYVQVATEDPPPATCTLIGPITAKSGGGNASFGARGTYEDAYNVLRNKAAEVGANYVRMDSQQHGTDKAVEFVIFGVGYFCPWESLPTPTSPPPI